jgi:cold shock CspA family protein
MMQGEIVKWFPEKKFGFIRCDAPDFADAFIHRDALPPGVCGAAGLRLEFDIGAPNDDQRGKGGRAVNVRAIS